MGFTLGATVVLHWYYIGITLVSQLCYRVVIMVSKWCDTVADPRGDMTIARGRV
jgi:hypothetical protein